MKRILLLSIVIGGTVLFINAQTIEELEAAQSAKKDTLARLEDEIKDLQSQIDAFPGWDIGAFGTIGINITNFNNWFTKEIPNSSGGAIGITINGFANYDDENHFWRNAGALNLGWVKFDDEDDPDDDDGYRQATDIFNLSSLYGRKLSKSWAASALVEYRSTILSNFNNPGYLDLGVGATWTPANGLYVVIHPLNYNIVFADSESIFESTFGTKLMADYSREFSNGIAFKSNLSTFLSYEDVNRSNWTWTNSFSYTLWKVIGLGFETGLRGNRQETLEHEIKVLGNEDATFDTIDNKLQSYFLMGISYKF
ncbi:MAG: DUF3078 domain-containing protein [Bacteroidetes bacterium]|nr:MAG: DUF3078 domain-containing protein [Bacteroidota bacterium]